MLTCLLIAHVLRVPNESWLHYSKRLCLEGHSVPDAFLTVAASQIGQIMLTCPNGMCKSIDSMTSSGQAYVRQFRSGKWLLAFGINDMACLCVCCCSVVEGRFDQWRYLHGDYRYLCFIHHVSTGCGFGL